MSTENYRVDKYQYELHQDTGKNRPQDFMLLFLYDERRELLCNVAFVSEDKAVLGATASAGGQVNVQLPISQFDRVIDMLRNEKPVYFSWCPETQSVRLSTNKEPVGEQELRRMFSFLYV